MKKVGRDFIESRTKRKVAYRDVEYDPEGWVDCKDYLPKDYDLMYLKISGKPNVSGWSVGNKWEGLKLKNKDQVIFWKKRPDEYKPTKKG